MISKMLTWLGLKKPAKFVNSQGSIHYCESLATGPRGAAPDVSSGSHRTIFGPDPYAPGADVENFASCPHAASGYPAGRSESEGSGRVFGYPARLNAVDGASFMTTATAGGATNPCIPAGPSAGVCETPGSKPLPADATIRNIGIGPGAATTGKHATKIGDGPMGSRIASGVGEITNAPPAPFNPYATHVFALGHGAARNMTSGHNNICIGDGAGADLTSESYQFCVSVAGLKLRTTMTHPEWEVINAVLQRAAPERRQERSNHD